jgi:hypothetical protein
MAHDIFTGENNRDWSRGSDSPSNIGRVYVDEIFSPRQMQRTIPGSCSERPIVVTKDTGMGWFGYTMAAMFATRILSGKWPWYWAGLAGRRLEGSATQHTPPVHSKG